MNTIPIYLCCLNKFSEHTDCVFDVENSDPRGSLRIYAGHEGVFAEKCPAA